MHVTVNRITCLSVVVALALALPGAASARSKSGSYAREVNKHVSWDNNKHVTFKFVNNIAVPIYVSTPGHKCMDNPIATAKVQPLQSFSSKVKFYWDSSGCSILERLPQGQAPWPITANTIYAELDVSTKSSLDVDGSYCGGFFSLWGASLQGHVDKVSVFQGEGDTRCTVSIDSDANTITFTANPK